MFKRKMIFSLLMVALFGVNTTPLTATEENITLKPNSNDEYIKYNTNSGDFFNDASILINKLMIDDEKYIKTDEIYQCTAPLPTAFLPSILGPLTQLKHTWLLIDGKSYGMPYTEKKTYFGGRAYITTPDMFIFEGKINLAVSNCTTIYRPAETTKENFKKKFKCIANKLSKNHGKQEDWVPIFDYHVFFNNCSWAIRYITECAEGKISQGPNFTVGSHMNENDPALIRQTLQNPLGIKLRTVEEISDYGRICDRARDECLI